MISLASLLFLALTPCSELNALWKSHFHADLDADWEKQSFRCPSPDATVAQALYDVYALEAPFNYYRWATHLITSTRYNPDCDAGVVASMRPDGRMTLCPPFYKSTAPPRGGTIVHEAAHAREEDPGHVTCTHGTSQGSLGGCDQKLYEARRGSGYNYEFAFLADSLRRMDPRTAEYAEARTYLKYLVLNRFNDVTNEQVKKWAGGNSSEEFLTDPLAEIFARLPNSPPAPAHAVSTSDRLEMRQARALEQTAGQVHFGPSHPLTRRVTELARESRNLLVVREAILWLRKSTDNTEESVRAILRGRAPGEHFALADLLAE